MNELWIAAALTFAASAHCLGMCGPIVLALAKILIIRTERAKGI